MSNQAIDGGSMRVPPQAYFAVMPQDQRPLMPPSPPRFDERLARESLATMNPGPDGLESLRACQCNTTIYDVSAINRCYALIEEKNEHSRLLRLPIEIREQIYAYVVTYSDPIPIRLRTTIQGGTAIIRQSSFFTPPFLKTSSQIEDEAAPIFHAVNTFRAEITDGDVSVLLRWLRETDPSDICHVRDLQIALAPISVFDVQEFRSRKPGQGTRELASAIVATGMDLGGVTMVWPRLSQGLELDAARIDHLGIVGVEELRTEWFDELGHWLDYEDAQREAEGLTRRFEGMIARTDGVEVI